MRKTSTLLWRAGVLTVVAGAVALSVSWNAGSLPVAHAYHTPEELKAFRGGAGQLPQEENTYFMGSGRCEGCHGHDPAGHAMITQDGVDVNVVDDWRSTMMANSAHDPFWRAKVSHEVTVNPAHRAALEDKCTSCHAPAGRYDYALQGHGTYGIADLVQDPVGLDGVSCVPCHIQSADSLGLHFSGKLKFDTLARPLYGPFDDVFASPMASFVGYDPQYGAHILDAGLCAGCHTLLTETADLEGTLTGDHFVEQATYHEWLNSDFNTDEHPEQGVTCQGCHMPLLNDDVGVVLSANYIFLQPKTPFGLHHFAGANTFMLQMLKDNIATLGLTAEERHFDSTIVRTDRMLKQHSLLVETSVVDRTPDTAFIDVKLMDLAGHKFPSGYPSRRAWVQLVVTNATDDTLYNNGAWDDTYEVIGHDAEWEPHHDVITSADQVQIYEMVMGDVNGDKTTVLERAKAPLKDNRIPPTGFTSTHYTYDTAVVANVPPSDIDFNRDADGVEGSGSDIVHYHVPMDGHTGLIHVKAMVWYQSSPARWMQEMFTEHTEEIDLFRDLFQAADNTPVLVQADSLNDLSTAVDDIRELGVRIFPNPVQNGVLTIQGLDGRVLGVQVFDAAGRSVAEHGPFRQPQWTLILPQAHATYIVAIRTADRTFVERVVAL